MAGAKQLSFQRLGLVAQISFAGVARVASYKTRDWISDVIAKATDPLNIDRVASEIVRRGTEAVRLVDPNQRMLTIVIAIAQPGKKPRLVLISNVDRLDGPRRNRVQNRLETFSLTASRPRILVLGCDLGVSKNYRRYLESLVRPNADPQSVMNGLYAANVRAAKNPRSQGFISEGCMVSSLKPDGRTSARNFGAVKGIPDSFLGPINIGEFLRKHYPGVTLVQSASTSTASPGNNRELLPEGEPRTLKYSNPTTSANGIGNISGGEFDKLTIEGLSGSVPIRKNEFVSVVLGKIHFEAGPTGPAPRDESEIPFFSRFAIQNRLRSTAYNSGIGNINSMSW